MLPWMEGPTKRVWMDGGHREVSCVLNDTKDLIISVLTGQCLVVRFRCEPMKEGLVNSQIPTLTLQIAQKYLWRECVCACAYHRADSARSSHQQLQKKSKNITRWWSKSFFSPQCVKKVLFESVDSVAFVLELSWGCLQCCPPSPSVCPPSLLHVYVCFCLCVCLFRAVQPLVEGKRHSTLHTWQTPPCVCHTARLLCGSVYVHLKAYVHPSVNLHVWCV